MTARYALYYTPATGSPLAGFGEAVLGRTATLVRSAADRSSFGDRRRWLALTRSPAHYGFHATLKAPFELAAGTDYEALVSHVRRFASEQSAIRLSELAPRHLAGFAALTLAQQPKSLTDFAQRIVEEFEPYRQPLSDADVKRRMRQDLTPRQQELLAQFGYPYVAEEFRFHMTLSGPLADGDSDYVDWLIDRFDALVDSTPVLDQLAIYGQRDREVPFVEMLCCPLSSTA